MIFSVDDGYFDTVTKDEFVKLHTKEPVYVLPGEPKSGIVHEGITKEQAEALYEKHNPKAKKATPAKE